jgi:hypothetical protein
MGKPIPILNDRVAETIVSTVVKSTARNLGVKVPTIKWTNAAYGRCIPKKGLIYIPHWAKSVGVGFLVYYAVHETCHLKNLKHNKEFKALEQLALKPFDLTIEYAEDYPEVLYWQGNPIYKRGGKNGNNTSIRSYCNFIDHFRNHKIVRKVTLTEDGR